MASWMLSGEAILGNFETKMVFDGWITYWTDNRSRSLMIVKDPRTGNEDRLEVSAPGAWWIIQHQMQIIEEMFGGTPMLEVHCGPNGSARECCQCDGTGGGYDHEGNWVDCPECRG